jgi:hypothetical protein
MVTNVLPSLQRSGMQRSGPQAFCGPGMQKVTSHMKINTIYNCMVIRMGGLLYKVQKWQGSFHLGKASSKENVIPLEQGSAEFL